MEIPFTPVEQAHHYTGSFPDRISNLNLPNQGHAMNELPLAKAFMLIEPGAV